MTKNIVYWYTEDDVFEALREPTAKKLLCSVKSIIKMICTVFFVMNWTQAPR